MRRYWQNGQLPYAELVVRSHAGDEARTERAMERSLATNADRQYDAIVQLRGTLCTVVQGGVETGARQAVEIFADLLPAQHTHMVIETGRNVLRAVPPDRRGHPAVRELLALTSGQRAP